MGKVAAIQMTSSHVVAENLASAEALLCEAKDAGALIACLPENFSFIGLKDEDKLPIAEPDGNGPVQAFLSKTAAKLNMWILGGTIVIRTNDSNRVANSSLLIDAQGKRVARYDKIHMFDVDLGEVGAVDGEEVVFAFGDTHVVGEFYEAASAVAAHRAFAAVGVVVFHFEVIAGMGVEEHEAVGADAEAAVA